MVEKIEKLNATKPEATPSVDNNQQKEQTPSEVKSENTTEEKKEINVEAKSEPSTETSTAESKTTETKSDVVEEKEVEVQAPKVDDETKSYLDSLMKEDESEKKETKSKDKSDKDSSSKEVADTKYLEKAKQYDELLSDPVLKAFVEFKKSGKSDPREFAEMVAGVDSSKMTSRQVYEHQLKTGGYNSEEIENELADFDSMSKIKQDNFVKPFRAEIEVKNQEKLKTFSSHNEAQQKFYAEEQKFQKQIIDKATNELNTTIEKMVGKKYEALSVTSDMAESIRDYVLNTYTEPIVDDKGKVVDYNIQSSIDIAMYKLYGKKMKKAIAEAAKAQGMEEVLKARLRPNKTEGNNFNQLDSSDDAKTASQAMRKQIREANGVLSPVK